MALPSKMSCSSVWLTFYKHRPELQAYVTKVFELNKETIGDPFDPTDKAEIWLPPPLNSLMSHEHNYHVNQLMGYINWYRTPTNMRIDHRDPVYLPGRRYGNSDYHVLHAMKSLKYKDERYNSQAYIVPVQYATRQLLFTLEEMHPLISENK